MPGEVIGYRITAVFPKDQKLVLGTIEKGSVLPDGFMQSWEKYGAWISIDPIYRRKNRTKVENRLIAEPFKPLTCKMPDCQWLGQTLSTHLRNAHHMSLGEYRDVFTYRGPAVVGFAAKKLEEITEQRQTKKALVVGRYLVEIRGDKKASLFRVSERLPSGQYVLELVCSSDSKYEEFGGIAAVTTNAENIYKKFKPVLHWDRKK